MEDQEQSHDDMKDIFGSVEYRLRLLARRIRKEEPGDKDAMLLSVAYDTIARVIAISVEEAKRK